MNSFITIRTATEKDAALILQCIKLLAEYEKMTDCVTATESLIYESLFVKKAAEVLIAEYAEKGEPARPAGFALFFHNFSTFIGKSGLYLEDLFVYPEFRGKGIGVKLFKKLIALAKERDCGRMEWACLNWNEPSIQFYKNFGAVPMDDWTGYRLNEDALKKIED